MCIRDSNRTVGTRVESGSREWKARCKRGRREVGKSASQSEEDVYKRQIVCNSITKTFNVPGVILSNLLIPDQGIRERMKETMDRWGLHNPNIFAAGIMEAAYTQCDEWIEQVNTYLDENYEFLKKYLEKNMPEPVSYTHLDVYKRQLFMYRQELR